MENLSIEQRAGGVIFRKNSGKIEYLLVTSKSNKDKWIFPAGHVEKGETFEMAASREVLEEAGIQAEIICGLGRYQYNWFRNQQKISLDTHMFLMKYLMTVEDSPEGRKVAFFQYEQIQNLDLWEESKYFLSKAHKHMGIIINKKGVL